MPLYLRDSISFGPFRINLSKSGLGMSVGIKGFRVGAGPRGHYIHAGSKGIYYRKTLGGLGGGSKQRKNPDPAGIDLVSVSRNKPATYLTQDGVIMRRIVSSGAEEMQTGNRSDAITSLNEARQQIGYFIPVLLLGAATTAFFAFAANSPVAAVIAGIITLIASIFAERSDVSRRNVVFAYQLDKGSEESYKELIESLDRLGKSDGLWYVEASGEINNLTAWKRNAGASDLVNKHKTVLDYELPPGVQSNISPPCMMVEGSHLYFMPDCLLVRQGNVYGAVSYDDLRLATRPSRFIVEDTVPRDCAIVGKTWKHPNKNGGPDRRFANNRELPICLFEELGIISTSGLKALIMASARDAISATENSLKKLAVSANETSAPDHILLTYEK